MRCSDPNPSAGCPASTRSRRRGLAAVEALGLLTLLLIGSWPFLATLGYWPMAPDSGLWIARGATFQDNWQEWVFHTRHFGVGYRPLTALSYTWNQAWGGLNPIVYRATDLALHLATASLLFALVRTALGARGRFASWAVLVVFLLTPAHESVVPYIARRGYSLASAWALVALWIAWSTRRREHDRGLILFSLPVALCLSLAVWSHEAALLALLGLPWPWAYARAGFLRRGRAFALATGLPALAVAAALATRLAVVEGAVGGYDGVAEERWPRALQVLAAAGQTLMTGQGTQATGSWLPWAGACAAAAFLLASLRPLGRAALQPAFVVLALAGVYASQGVWFDRQAYLLSVPLAVASGLWLSLGLASGGLPARLLGAGPAGLWILLVASHSCVVRGPAQERVQEWAQRQGLIENMARAIEGSLDQDRETSVYLVLPYQPKEEDMRLKARSKRNSVSRQDRQPMRWIETLFWNRKLDLQEWIYIAANEPDSAQQVKYVTERGESFLGIPQGWNYQQKNRRKFQVKQAGPEEKLKLPVVMADERAFLFLPQSNELIPLAPRGAKARQRR